MPSLGSSLRPVAYRLLTAVLLCLCFLTAGTGLAVAEPVHHDQTPAAAPPAPAAAVTKMQALRDLLADPDVQAMMARRPSRVEEAPAQAPPPGTMAVGAADKLQTLRAHILMLLSDAPKLETEAASAGSMVATALDERGWETVAGSFAVFVLLGFGVEALFRLAMRPAQRWLLGLTLDTVNERVRAVFARLTYGLGLVICFTAGSVGAFLLFDWPAVIKEILLGYLIAFLSVRLTAVVGRILLAPGAARFRLVPITTPGAFYVYRRWIGLAILIGFAWQTIDITSRFGLSPTSTELCGDVVALLVLLVGLDFVWRAPRMRLANEMETKRDEFLERNRAGVAFVRSGLLVALWTLWVVGASQLFWLLAFATALPVVVVVARDSVNHVLRPAGSSVSIAESKTLDVVVFERGARGVIIVGAALLLARILGVDFTSLAMQDTLTTRIVRSGVSIVVILLAADFLWNVAKALVDRKLALGASRTDREDIAHAARLQTLLPILSNILRIVIVVVAAMMALAAGGIEIGPLVASAGVVGVAIGFGAQTLVKDIISGIFYLFDDAFRIGEYIQSGSYKGTVESFSLRSIKLRHQRGALYTVPFGILGAVQNQSRDWVVDKIVMNVPYGTDLEKVRKLVKKVGERLAEDPELGPGIISPLKMQGVVQFGDFAIQIQTKMMTKPGDVQFLGRRRALLLINQTFSENGIGFAVPTVQVSGDAPVATIAAAQRGLDLRRPVKVD